MQELTVDAQDRSVNVPHGTVTFLFTDIEGSTKLLEKLKEKYADLLAEQRDLMRKCFARWNGHEIDTQGDSFFVVFSRALDAVHCIIEAQSALSSHTWTEGVTVRVRMGLHTGEPIVGRTGYVGMDVHRAARIAAAGHGGQILLSQTTRDLVYQDLPPDVHLSDLGAHKLKDIRFPQQIFQLVINELPGDFPPLKTLATEDEPPTPGEPPFKGLHYFDQEDAHLFFGRSQVTERLVEAVLSKRFLAIIGASGSGKSSVVRAGLVPAIRQIKTIQSQVFVLTPTARPLEALAVAMTRGEESITLTARLQDDLISEPRSLHLYARKSTTLSDKLLLVVVDQFEELFTLCRDPIEKQAFIDVLLVAATIPDGPFHILINLRADFYDHLAEYTQLRDAVAKNQEYLGAMNAEELRQAIEEPAKLGGWEFSPGLVELMLHEVGAEKGRQPEPGALPLLSHALLETWKHRRGNLMNLKAYAESGGVRKAIARTAENLYTKELTPDQQKIARNVFLRLTELGEGTQDTRRRAAISELFPPTQYADPKDVNEVLIKLADARLIITGEGVAEVAHEALIREWPTLREWLTQDREGLRLQRHLSEAAQEWEILEHDPGALYRGTKLNQALDWAMANPRLLNLQEQAYLEASREASLHEQAEREAQRQRELESAQKLAETERQRAEEQGRSAKRLRTRARMLVEMLAIALIFLFVAIGLGLAASNSRKIAQTESNNRATAIVQARSEANQRATAEAQAKAEADRRATAEVNALSEANNRATAEAIAEEQRDQALTNLQGLQAYQMAAESIRLSLEGKGNELAALLAVSSLNKQYTVQGEEALARAAQLPYPLRVFQSGIQDELRTAVLSQDGTKISAVRLSGNPLLWDVQTGQLLQEFQGFQGGSYTAMTPDGRYIASVGVNGQAMVWETSTGKQVLCVGTKEKTGQCQGVKTILPDNNKVSNERGLGLSGDDRFLLAGLNDGTVRTWEVSTGREVLCMEGHTAPLVSVIYSKDYRYIVSAASDNTVRLWDAQTGEQIQSFTGHVGEIHGLVLSPDSRFVASSSLDNTSRVWEVATGKEVQRIDKAADNIDISPDGRYVVINEILWDWQSGKTIQYAMPHTCWGASFSWDGKSIARACIDGNVYLWAVKPTPLERQVPLYGSSYSYLGISPDGKTLVVDVLNEVVLIDFASGKEIARLPATEQIWNVGFSRDGHTIYATGLGGGYFTWDTSTRKIRSQFRLDQGGVGEVSPDGKQWIVWDYGSLNDYWIDAVTGKTLCTFPGPYLQEAIFSPDGKRVALGGGDEGKNVVRIFSLPDCQNIQNLDASEGSLVVSEAFSPDGRYLAASLASENNPVIIWDTQTGEIAHEFQTLPSYSWDLTYSPDGKYLAATSDNTYIWDTSSWNVVRRIVGIWMGVVFSPDGNWVMTTSLEQLGLKWSYFNLQELKDAVCQSLWRELTDAERIRFGITTNDPACP